MTQTQTSVHDLNDARTVLDVISEGPIPFLDFLHDLPDNYTFAIEPFSEYILSRTGIAPHTADLKSHGLYVCLKGYYTFPAPRWVRQVRYLLEVLGWPYDSDSEPASWITPQKLITPLSQEWAPLVRQAVAIAGIHV